jgi:uncharacterized membrane protein YdjX (TVP38/TMEM64 family)
MQRLLAFLMNMDARAWRALAVSFVLFGGVGLVFLFGASLLGLDGAVEVERWMSAGSHGPWALPLAVASFAAFAFLGVPQFMLIAAAVVVFGPWTGFAYSWTGTLISSLVGFWLGRRIGARALDHVGGPGLKRFMAMLGRNGFMASLIVRLAPSAPFIVVNMAAGVTPMRLLDFAAGTAIGIVPKIALIAFAGASAVRAFTGGGLGHWAILAMAAGMWIGSVFLARAWMRRREAADPPEPV